MSVHRYTPQASQALEDKRVVDAVFGFNDKDMYYYVEPDDPGDIKANLLTLMDIWGGKVRPQRHGDAGATIACCASRYPPPHM